MRLTHLSRSSKSILTTALAASVLALGAADFLTGSELAFSIFYLFPVGVAAWYVHRNAGVVLSVLSALSWYAADALARTTAYSSAFIPAWNTGVRLATFFAVAMLLAVLREALERESVHARIDPLTGAANSRAFYETVAVEISKLKRFARPFAMLYLDVDNLKQVNDTRGHTAGDKALTGLVTALKRSLRAGDTVARMGGDEFAILLAEADERAAEAVSERLRSLLRAGVGAEHGVTFSIGVLSCSSPPSSVDDIIEQADNLMYEAKHSGKDAVRRAAYRGQA